MGYLGNLLCYKWGTYGYKREIKLENWFITDEKVGKNYLYSNDSERESQKLSGNFQLTNLVNNKTLLFYWQYMLFYPIIAINKKWE